MQSVKGETLDNPICAVPGCLYDCIGDELANDDLDSNILSPNDDGTSAHQFRDTVWSDNVRMISNECAMEAQSLSKCSV